MQPCQRLKDSPGFHDPIFAAGDFMWPIRHQIVQVNSCFTCLTTNHVPHLESPEDPAPQLAAGVGRLKARDLSLAPQLAAIQRHLHTDDLAAATCEDAAAAAAAGAATRHVSKHVVHLALATIQRHLNTDDLRPPPVTQQQQQQEQQHGMFRSMICI
jgi:hypothetical protein